MSTTVSGSIKDLSTAAATSNMFLRFILRGTQGSIPRVNGTALIAQSQAQGNVWYQDFAPNASGAISGTLYSTRDAAGTGDGEIDVSGSKTAVWYGMVLYTGGIPGPEIPVHAKNGATLDPSNVTPLTTVPVVTAGTGDTTYLRLDGGNSPATGVIQFTSAVSLKAANGYRFADQFATGSTTGGIQEAINSCPSGGTVFVSSASGYALTAGSSTELILIDKPLKLIGCGWNGTVSSGATLTVGASVAGTIDVIRIKGTAAIEGVEIAGLQILAASGTPGRHGINIDTSSFAISKVNIHDNYIGPLGGKAIVSTNATPLTDGWFVSFIERNVLWNGMALQNAGDAIKIRDNDMQGSNTGCDVSFVTGAGSFEFYGNTVTNTTAGLHISSAIASPRIMFNEFEGSVSVTGSNSAYIDLDGASGKVISNAVILGNQIAPVATNIHGLRLNWVDGAQVGGNLLSRSGGSGVDILVTANAVAGSTFIQPNYYVPTTDTQSQVLSDSGSSRVWWTFPYSQSAQGGHGSGVQLTTTLAANAVMTPSLFANDATNGYTLQSLTGTATLFGKVGTPVNLTAQAAAIGSTLLFTVPSAGGLYRVNWVATVTQAATTSSTLGGAAGFQLTYTDADDSVVKTTPAAGAPSAGVNQAYSQTNQGNTTGTQISGQITLWAKASTAINYQFGYTTSGVTAMQYNLHVNVESFQ